MVESAPKFYEIAKEIVLKTEGTIFVAHNVLFDYSFIKEEFERLGYTFSKKKLCTVKLSRKAFPDLKSYSLGSLINHFKIQVNARHRAFEDALATSKIFERIMEIQGNKSTEFINAGLQNSKLPEALTPQRIEDLPEKTGVYYFFDEYGKVIYIGKSTNIQSRIKQHFTQVSAKTEKLIRLTKDLDFELTGSELIALLLESEHIKIMKPTINKAQRNSNYPIMVYTENDANGYLNFHIDKANATAISSKNIVSYFVSLNAAKSKLAVLRADYMLCESKMHAKGELPRNCIYHKIGECLGACIHEEEPETYNVRAKAALDYLNKIFNRDFLIVTQGRNYEENGLILIQNGSYRGYGYIPIADSIYGIEECLEAIEHRKGTIESNAIIKSYIDTKQDFKIIYLDKNEN
jgi:DNA polymerase-3 subunit epsilon